MSDQYKRLLQPDISAFIKAHEKADVKALGLKKPPCKSWPYALILDQIKARQKAATKLPEWLCAHPDIIFPAPDIIEQASSSVTARYKASLVTGEGFVDFSAGAGIDSQAFLQKFSKGICIERDQDCADLLAYNLPLLSKKPLQIHCDEAQNFLSNMKSSEDFAYIDPQRRETGRRSLFRFETCSPNILDMMPDLREKFSRVMIKTSPVLDISQAIETLQYVSAVHVLEWRGDCKEVLYLLDFAQNTDAAHVPITVVRLDDEGAILNQIMFTRAQEKESQIEFTEPAQYLYEPSAAFLKSGAFRYLAAHYNLGKLHPDTHLYSSEALITDFPGRAFEVQALYPVDRKALPLRQANLSVRNFPMDVETLKKKLKLKDGGQDYLFACTLFKGQKSLIHVRKTPKVV